MKKKIIFIFGVHSQKLYRSNKKRITIVWSFNKLFAPFFLNIKTVPNNLFLAVFQNKKNDSNINSKIIRYTTS